MTSTIRKKAKRHLLSALLSGVFSDREISEISAALIRGDDFAPELGRTLRQIADQITDSVERQPRHDSKVEILEFTSPEAEAMDLVKLLGMTQRELISLISQIAPEAAASLMSKRLPTVGIIGRFFRNQTTERGDELIEALKKRAAALRSTGADPYLDLISKKLEQT